MITVIEVSHSGAYTGNFMGAPVVNRAENHRLA